MNMLRVTLFVLYGIAFVKNQEAFVPNPLREERTRSATFGSVQDKADKTVIKRAHVSDEFECLHQCLSHPTCQSFNYQTIGSPKHLCELSESSASSSLCQEPRPGYKYYFPIKNIKSVSCVNGKTCKNGGACAPLCSAQVCQCEPFNKGEYCEQWTTGVASCKDIVSKTSYRKDMTYTFVIDGKQTDIYCHLSSLCGSSGWTMVMKIDGTTADFSYTSTLWTKKAHHNLTAGQSGFDSYQTKMPSYWAIPFTKLCLGMKVGNDLRWISITKSATSLWALIYDGGYRRTSIGKGTWMSLIARSSLQPKCNKEGFNTGRVRIGIHSNQENDCNSPDSYIGFGSAYAISCGNQCRLNCNNGDKNTRGFGYILIH